MIIQKLKEVYFYTDLNKKCHALDWLDKLDRNARARIRGRITRLEYGTYGDYKNIEGKIYELRFFFGKGYRIYFTEQNNKIILLFNGGDKDSQARDIRKAKELFSEYLAKEK